MGPKVQVPSLNIAAKQDGQGRGLEMRSAWELGREVSCILTVCLNSVQGLGCRPWLLHLESLPLPLLSLPSEDEFYLEADLATPRHEYSVSQQRNF